MHDRNDVLPSGALVELYRALCTKCPQILVHLELLCLVVGSPNSFVSLSYFAVTNVFCLQQ